MRFPAETCRKFSPWFMALICGLRIHGRVFQKHTWWRCPWCGQKQDGPNEAVQMGVRVFFVGLGWDPDSVYNEIRGYSDELLDELERELQITEPEMNETHKMLCKAALSWVRDELEKRKR